jgi:hypothetical protein
VICWYLGKLDAYLPRPIRSVSVLGDMAPARSEAAPPPAAPTPAARK